MKRARRLLLLLACVGCFFTASKIDHIRLLLTPTPDLITESLEEYSVTKVLIIGSGSICSICPSGRTVLTTAREEALFVLPLGTTEAEIANFRLTYQINGPIISSDEKTNDYMDLVSKCEGLPKQGNFIYAMSDATQSLQFLESF